MVACADLWEVVGGSEKGGIIVRADRGTNSQEALERLATGAIVEALEDEGGRVRYRLVSGRGPATGWVSLRAKGKPLLASLGGGFLSDDSAEAAAAKVDVTSPLAALKQEYFPCESQSADDEAMDSDGEVLELCTQCRLPLGQRAYAAHAHSRQCRGRVHGECMAEVMARCLREAEAERRESEVEGKAARRAEHGIGWTPAHVAAAATGVAPAATLADGRMCCLVLDESTKCIRAAATSSPAAAVNLEYLSLALAVRRKEGREPRFSLDPVSQQAESIDDNALVQRKRFEPAWLAGTSVGDVLFQADYYLKELSMGEYEQPVVGMRSCFDHVTGDDCQVPWSAREWFMVRKAEVCIAEDGSLLPRVAMGVEAREQLRDADGLYDAPITRPDHPLVKYAEDFTRNFDLIAERRSVVYHLRELAKASVLAKFLGEAEINVEDAWFDREPHVREDVPLLVPQLWNRRCQSRICVDTGKIQQGIKNVMHGVYGGVDFGLNRFTLSSVSPAPGSGPAPLPERRLLAFGAYQSSKVWGGERRTPLTAKPKFHQAQILRQPRPLRGVDLSLDEFPLDDVHRSATPACSGSWRAAAASGAEAFWAALEEGCGGKGGADDCGDSAPTMTEDDRHLLRQVFNPSMSDRRGDGVHFVAPDPSFDYVVKLQGLAKKEELVQRDREAHFFGAGFAADDPGALFPSSWSSCSEVARGKVVACDESHSPVASRWHSRSEWLSEPVLLRALLASAPVFDRIAEDGARYRIYRIGAVEARTSQRPGGSESVGAVFSAQPPQEVGAVAPRRGPVAGAESALDPGERIAKVTEYVEKALVRQHVLDGANDIFSRRHFVVLETAQGAMVVTERLPDGTVAWEEQPPGLRARLAEAKVFRSAALVAGKAGQGATLEAARKSYAEEAAVGIAGAGSASSRKRYARRAYTWAFAGGAAAAHVAAAGAVSRRAAGAFAAWPDAGRRRAGGAAPRPPRYVNAQGGNLFSGLFTE